MIRASEVTYRRIMSKVDELLPFISAYEAQKRDPSSGSLFINLRNYARFRDWRRVCCIRSSSAT
jgi:hypothetical protein